ncbi:chemotaxis response regulator protein-glutamate methylesterase [Leptospira wolffii]|uniref:protein-glutamate methylesterase/protein-glutamine glutaminase n=1 Tax=Leptospira wolffii TaxID=409998 RepID=UPI0010835F12|nr:chemotaxis response regulator protein-glutamate methylesterase [Leptospira wolffii]TGK62571.1 chemotaxis response regulator protein-glutamate methylesterase [Leptospira wolffii]TGK70361.1 chemotaxis response regulator protein-glutamate methylesterase [Leptospira wolffii]TGK74044.1 chemotaxis response regulator protein-glutamate methylesterase [Leptospira wolffii]TGL28903.1 chemotaxis response regulator protein-glutamate methylesterase [Leptospira wolffii]
MIRVYVIDDNRIVREIIVDQLTGDPRFEVVGSNTATVAMSEIPKVRPDVITLDVEMPDISGIEFLQWLMPKYPTPVIMLSSFTEVGAKITLDSLQAGALDFVRKADGTENDFLRMVFELKNKIRACSKTDVTRVIERKKSLSRERSGERTQNTDIRLILIGASTGGTQAIEFILRNLPGDLPPIMIVQHMPEYFTSMFAERLDSISPLKVLEAENGQELRKGTAFIARGDYHLELIDHPGYKIRVQKTDKVTGHRPSVDMLFHSVAKTALSQYTAAFLLTGMGKDGAKGLKALSENGAYTFGQDEASSVVYGMPREAYEIGAVREQIPLGAIPDRIAELCYRSADSYN